ncbi:MAG TPA: hypothetical protein H9894_09455 [Candidatus Desulfovibrio intestinipullorum]|uniref:Uncharacterized protein n=1 Tax=Candidatus Desulfovibrio intestinipullorum TaxID=2838536 RepID=A0A9D1PZ63_9BACT|nr:hypothetical protein [Candidatus Desulfovibrio intestinipullorum]
MKSSVTTSRTTAIICAAGILFCLWVYAGTGEQVCFTAGCSLYQQSSVAGLPLWWIGVAGFAVLGLLALAGKLALAYMAAWLGLLIDAGLLALMLLTAPCFNCLIVAVLLMAAFVSLRRGVQDRSWSAQKQGRSVLVLVWSFFFICNVGIVLKSSVPLWDISDNAEDASVRMFFSPSCSKCRQGVAQLSGNIDVAFYPVAETDWDVKRIAHMQESLAGGMNMYEAFMASSTVERPTTLELYSPSMIALRLKLLCNMAHIYMDGGRVVPYIEYRGLPAFLDRENSGAPQTQPLTQSYNPNVGQGSVQTHDPTRKQQDDMLFLEGSSAVGGACYGDKPCPEDEGSAYTPVQGYGEQLLQ